MTKGSDETAETSPDDPWVTIEIAASSNIAAVRYCADRARMRVTFANGGRYEYRDVPQTVVDDWAKAESSGRYFHSVIRRDTKYAFTKLDPKEPTDVPPVDDPPSGAIA